MFDLGSHVYMTYSNYKNEGTLDLCQYCYIDGKGHLKYFVTQGFSKTMTRLYHPSFMTKRQELSSVLRPYT